MMILTLFKCIIISVIILLIFLMLLIYLSKKDRLNRIVFAIDKIFKQLIQAIKKINADVEQDSDSVKQQQKGESVKLLSQPENKKEKMVKETKTDDLPELKEAFAQDSDDWTVIGTSVQGNSHIEKNIPCQDSCSYEYISDGWGIAITSDGAGSCKLSDIGSKKVVELAKYYFKILIEKEGWIKDNTLPTESRWMKVSYEVLKKIKDDFKNLAEDKKTKLKDYSATVIVVIHSPMGLLVTHIGDGRAGYETVHGEWHYLITPHKGEEANQTVFFTGDFWNIPYYEMSGVLVPESCIIREKVKSFVLMSDGCENSSYLCNQFDDKTNKYYDPNIPFSKFFEPLVKTILKQRKENTPIEERKQLWYKFIKEGNDTLRKESDDKTMIIGVNNIYSYGSFYIKWRKNTIRR